MGMGVLLRLAPLPLGLLLTLKNKDHRWTHSHLSSLSSVR